MGSLGDRLRAYSSKGTHKLKEEEGRLLYRFVKVQYHLGKPVSKQTRKLHLAYLRSGNLSLAELFLGRLYLDPSKKIERFGMRASKDVPNFIKRKRAWEKKSLNIAKDWRFKGRVPQYAF